MINPSYWHDKIRDPNTKPNEEIERVKQLKQAAWLTHSNWNWNYTQQLANNTFSMKKAFDTVIEILERSYYHDMLENELVTGFYKHIGNTNNLIATNEDPSTVEGIGGGELDRIPDNALHTKSRGRDTSLESNTIDRSIVINPITHRAQPDLHDDYYGRNIAAKLGVTWFKYVWTWEFIETMNREVFERTKLLNKWLDKATFCHYHDIFQHSLLVYVNGLPLNNFEVMYTKTSNMLKLPFDSKIFSAIQKREAIDLRIYRIASKKHYWAHINYPYIMQNNGGIIDSHIWEDYQDIFETGDTDLVILNMCESKNDSNLAYRDQQGTEMLQGPETVYLHLHQREDGTRYLDLNEMDPQVLSWWKAVNKVDVDIIRPKNMHEYSANGEYPFEVTKDGFPDDTTSDPSGYNNRYGVIDINQNLSLDNITDIGISEEDFICYKQAYNDSSEGKNKINDGWRPYDFDIIRSYPNTFRIGKSISENDVVEVKPYRMYFDVLNNLTEDTGASDDIDISQSNIEKSSEKDTLPAARVFYFTKTLYEDTDLDPIVLRAMKVARRYLFNPYKYTPPTIGNLKVGTEFTIPMDGVSETFIVLKKDVPIKGKTLCIKKYALKAPVANDYFDIYDEEFTTPQEEKEYQAGDRSHLWGRFSISALQFIEKNDIPYFKADGETASKNTRFFDASADDVAGYSICYTDKTEKTKVRWRLRDQSSTVKTYIEPYNRPAYEYCDENGEVKSNMYPDEEVYLRPCILLDNDYDFIRWNNTVDGIKVQIPDYLQPYPLTHWSDAELLKVISTNRQYFLKYIKTLFPDDNWYGVEKFYKYSDQNMANQMDIVESVPEYDSITDGIEGAPYGNGNQVLDYKKPNETVDTKHWVITSATIAYIPEKINPYDDDSGWAKNYSIGSHIVTSNGVELVVNMARYHMQDPLLYKKTLAISNGGAGYMVHDRIYIRNSNDVNFVTNVRKIDSNGRVIEVDITTWIDTESWDNVAVVVGGHGSGVAFSLKQELIRTAADYDYYPYIGMELHIEHPHVYDFDPAGRFLTTETISGTGEGLLVHLESAYVDYSPERDREMWMYPFDYLTLKLKNFIKLYPDNFMTYLEKQYQKPFEDITMRIFRDTDISEYKRYYSKNIYTYNSSIDMDHNIRSTEFVMPRGYHSKLKDIKVFREYDVFTSNGELVKHLDDSGDIFDVDLYGKPIWKVSVLTDDGKWIDVQDPNYDVKHSVKLYHLPSFIYVESENIPAITSCSVHWEFLTIRDTNEGEMYQEDTIFDRFDKPKFCITVPNSNNDEIIYQPFLAGFEKSFCEKDHCEENDYIYLDWEEVNQLKNSFIETPAEQHSYYEIEKYKIIDGTTSGLSYHPGMELHLECVSGAAKGKVQMLAIVDRVDTTGTVTELHIHDHQRVFKDYDPTGTWKVIVTDYQRANDKFHIGNGEQNSEDPDARDTWFNDNRNRESKDTPTIEVVGKLIRMESIPAHRYAVEVNNTLTIKKLHPYYWEEEFDLPAVDTNWGPGAILHPTENHYNELHLEDLKIVDTDTNKLVPYDIGDGKEVFTLTDIEPDVNKSVMFKNRYDMKHLKIREYNLNLKQSLYGIDSITTKSLRYVSKIKRTSTVGNVVIDPNAMEWVESSITIENIEPGNETYGLKDLIVPENIFRDQWGISASFVFDHQDYTFTNLPLRDTNNKIVMYVDILVRHVTMPFNYNGSIETINDHTVPIANNKPNPPVGPSHPDWKSNMKYYPSTDEYANIYNENGGISPSSIDGVDWKPDRYDFPFEKGSDNYNDAYPTAVGTGSNQVENSYIKILHIYNVKAATGITAIPRSNIWASPSSKYNNDIPSDSLSYIDPPVFINLTSKMKPYTGLVFTYSEGDKWEYDDKIEKWVKTDTKVAGYWRRVFVPGMNTKYATLVSDDGSEVSIPIKVYIGKREKGVPDGNWTLQGEEFGYHVQQFAIKTSYSPILSRTGSATNIFDGNYGNPNFNFPQQETPLYVAKYSENGKDVVVTVSSEDPYYPQFDTKYLDKIHENTMRNAGYKYADYTPYQSRYSIWYDVPDTTIQCSNNGQVEFAEDWIHPINTTLGWNYSRDIINTEKVFEVDAYTNPDMIRDRCHCESVFHSKIKITLWQSQDPKDGFIQYTDSDTGLKYGIKFEVDGASRQFVKWNKFSDTRWNYEITETEDNWFNNVGKPIRIPYSIHGKIQTEYGIDDEDRELHRGNYWIYITPKLSYLGTALVAGTREEILATEGIDHAIAVVLTPVDGVYQSAAYLNGKWNFSNYVPEENISFGVIKMHGTNRSTTIAFLGGKWIEYEDRPVDSFSAEGDAYELYTETRLYKIHTAYERGIIENIHVFDTPTIYCYDFSYLYGSEYYSHLMNPQYVENLFTAMPYFYKGYQKTYAQVVNTMKEELMWLPVWTYIGDGEPPYDEDDPNRSWHKVEQIYTDINGKKCPVWVAYHNEDFPRNIDQQIKDTHHTYFENIRDIFFTFKSKSRRIKSHDISVYPLPRESVMELDYGFKYTDIQYQLRIAGKAGHYKAFIDMRPYVFSSGNKEKSVEDTIVDRVLTEDRISIVAVDKDRTYNVPLLNVPAMKKVLSVSNPDASSTALTVHRYKKKGIIWNYIHNVYPKNPVFMVRTIAPTGLLDMNYPYLKKLWFRSQFNSDRYEIYSNGRLLTEGDQYTIITPTKILFHGLTSLHNIEIYEINREPKKELFKPTGDMRNRLDAIVAGCAINGRYDGEFTYEEQAAFLPENVWPQLDPSHEKFPYFPYNVDMDEDILAIPDNAKVEGNYSWIVDLPFIEGAAVATDVGLDDFYPYLSAGMDTQFMDNKDISDIFEEAFTVKFDDGRHDARRLEQQFHLIWDKTYRTEDWLGTRLPNTHIQYNYLLDDRYKDHFPQYNKLFSNQKDRLYHDPTKPEYPLLLERDWIRYWYNLPDAMMKDSFRVIWDKSAHMEDWKPFAIDASIGGRYNWKGWSKPSSIEDMNYYTLWKVNSKANPEKPWENQKNRSYYEPDKVFVEPDKKNLFSSLGTHIRAHYPDGTNGWYPWNNTTLDGKAKFWDTGRYLASTEGQVPYSVQININPNRKAPEIYKSKYLGNNKYQLWIDGIYEGDYGTDALAGVIGIRVLVYDANSGELLQNITNPNKYLAPTSIIISDLADGKVYDIYVAAGSRSGIRQGKKFTIDRTNLNR